MTTTTKSPDKPVAAGKQYVIGDQVAIWSHMPKDLRAALAFVRDTEEPYTEADALAASGDYLELLAYKLDMLAQSMPLDSSEQIELENLASRMFYLHENYDLTAKKKRRA